MGHNKLLLEPGGEPLVRRAVRTALGAGLGPVLVVTGHQRAEVEAALAGLACTAVFNPDYQRGMNTSLRAGFRAVSDACAGAVVLLGDMPFIEREHVERLCEVFRAGTAKLVVSRFRWRRSGPGRHRAAHPLRRGHLRGAAHAGRHCRGEIGYRQIPTRERRGRAARRRPARPRRARRRRGGPAPLRTRGASPPVSQPPPGPPPMKRAIFSSCAFASRSPSSISSRAYSPSKNR